MTRRPPTLIEAAEWLFSLAALLMMSEALIGPLVVPDQNLEGPPWLRLLWLPFYAGMAALLVLRLPRLGRVWLPGAMTLALVALAFLSTQWSVAPDITQRRALALLFTSLFGLQLAARYGWRGLIELFAATFAVLAVGSTLAALAFPDFGVHADIHPGAWRGLWYEKNQMGGVMAKGVLACLCAAMMVPQRRAPWIGVALLCAALVLMSTSKTALLGMLLVLGGAALIAGLRRGGAPAVAMVWGAVVAGGVGLAVFVLTPELVFEALGKDPTLTGRTDIWAALMRRVEVRPWEGYGYAAFWKDELGPAYYIRQAVEWEAPTAHNGWLDILVQLGWVGLILTAVHIAVGTLAAGSRLLRGPEGYWSVLSMALFLLFSLSESTILQQNNISWVLYVATVAKLLETPTRPVRMETPALIEIAAALGRLGTEWERPQPRPRSAPQPATIAAAESLRRTSA